MGLSLIFLFNSQISIIDISSRCLYLHDLYSAMSDIYFMISLYSYLILHRIRRENLVPRHLFQYLYVCSSMVFVHRGGGGSARYCRVLLINVDMVSRLIRCCWMSPFPTICGNSEQVTVLFGNCNSPHSVRG